MRKSFDKKYWKEVGLFLSIALVAGALFYLLTFTFAVKDFPFKVGLQLGSFIVATVFVLLSIAVTVIWELYPLLRGRIGQMIIRRRQEKRETAGAKRVEQLITDFKTHFRLELEAHHLSVSDDYLQGFSERIEVAMDRRQRKILTPWVVSSMAEYASRFENAIEAENAVLKTSLQLGQDRDKLAVQVAEKRAAVATAKKEYWSAQKCLKELGFENDEPFYGITLHNQYLSLSMLKFRVATS